MSFINNKNKIYTNFMFFALLFILLISQPTSKGAENHNTSYNEHNYVLKYNRDYNYKGDNYQENFTFNFNISIIEGTEWFKRFNVNIFSNASIASNIQSNFTIYFSQISSNLITQLTLPHALIYLHPPSYEIINKVLASFFIHSGEEWADKFVDQFNDHWRDSVDPEQQTFNPNQYTLYSFHWSYGTGWYDPHEQPDHASGINNFGTHTYVKNLINDYIVNNTYYQPYLEIENSIKSRYHGEMLDRLEVDINTNGLLNQTEFTENITLSIHNPGDDDQIGISFEDVPAEYKRKKYTILTLMVLIPIILLFLLFIILKKLINKLRSIPY